MKDNNARGRKQHCVDTTSEGVNKSIRGAKLPILRLWTSKRRVRNAVVVGKIGEKTEITSHHTNPTGAATPAL